MTKSTVSLLFLLLTLLLTFTSGEKMKFANGPETVTQKTWCVAKASASEVGLNLNIEYACNELGDCSMIQQGEELKFANGPETVTQKKTWCVAKASASEIELKLNIEYACNELGDCSMIQPGGSCYNPNTPISHASAVMNQFYAMSGRNPWDCYFTNSGLISLDDPSYGSCKYA